MVSLFLGYVAITLDDSFLTFDDYVGSKRRKPITLVKQYDIVKQWNPQLHRRENLKTRTVDSDC
jgi:hypothetical protein